jgi:hypothetical protein
MSAPIGTILTKLTNKNQTPRLPVGKKMVVQSADTRQAEILECQRWTVEKFQHLTAVCQLHHFYDLVRIEAGERSIK